MVIAIIGSFSAEAFGVTEIAEMFSNSGKKKCVSGRNSRGEVDRDSVAALNLSVNGAPALMHSQRPKTFREYKSYRYVREEKVERRERSFPVDKIVYLAERLELRTGLTPEDVAADGPSGLADERLPSGFSLDLSSITAEESEGVEQEGSSLRGPETVEGPKDLISMYVRSVDKERNLERYFRACDACGETWCVCACASDGESEEGGGACGFECCCPDFFETDYPQSAGGEECRCQCGTGRGPRGAPRGPPSSDRVLAYTSSLANAAKSARVLARDLELVLNTLRTDLRTE